MLQITSEIPLLSVFIFGTTFSYPQKSPIVKSEGLERLQYLQCSQEAGKLILNKKDTLTESLYE